DLVAELLQKKVPITHRSGKYAGRRERRMSRLCLLFAALLSLIWVSPARAGEPTPVTFLTWKPSRPEVWKGLIDQFHRENPDIRINLQVGPHSSTEYHAIVSQRLKNKDPSVDLFFMDVIWPPEFISAGWVLDLSSRFPIRERERFLPGPITANTRKGRIHGVPCYLAAGLFYYRKDLLDKYALNPPVTWTEMLHQGKAILQGEKEPGLHIYSAQFKQYEGLVCNILEFIWSNGGDILDLQSGRPLLTEPPALEAVTFVRDHLVGKAAPRGSINYEEPESLDLFIQGKALFHRNWPYAWTLANDPEKSTVAGRIGVGGLPAFPGHRSASTLGGWQFGINRWSRHADRAWRFIRFMTSPQSQKVLALKAGLAPTRRAVYHDGEVKEKMPHLMAFLPVFERARPRPLTPVYSMMSQELQRYFSKAIVDPGSDLQDLARNASQRIHKLAQLGAKIGP
ncbi:MAG: ABC transporter substrate-binding protein, partial [Pseudomonadota bacterium]